MAKNRSRIFSIAATVGLAMSAMNLGGCASSIGVTDSAGLVEVSLPDRERAVVAYHGPEKPGTILISDAAKSLYLIREDGKTAYSFAITIPKDDADRIKGNVHYVGRITHNPTWTPTPLMREAAKRGGYKLPDRIPAGPDNPMGKVKMHLSGYYYIHGTSNEYSIGYAGSAGCIRLSNKDAVFVAKKVEWYKSSGQKVKVGFYIGNIPGLDTKQRRIKTQLKPVSIKNLKF